MKMVEFQCDGGTLTWQPSEAFEGMIAPIQEVLLKSVRYTLEAVIRAAYAATKTGSKGNPVIVTLGAAGIMLNSISKAVGEELI